MATTEQVWDYFAGGGGASLGIQWALGRGPDVAVNHEPRAIAMHLANHPDTRHITESAYKVNPKQLLKGGPVGLLWASPDCTDFSRAKGGKPVKKNIRGLAWAVARIAKDARPRVIVLENVREFEQWGPLVPMWTCGACKWKGTEGQLRVGRRTKRNSCPECESVRVKKTKDEIRDPGRVGQTFEKFVKKLKALGYAVQWRTLNAADFGAPTHRRRLFLIARCDGKPIVWPEPTNCDPEQLKSGSLFEQDMRPWRTAAECIDWSIPCPSIFLTKDEAKQWGREHGCEPPRRPLKPNTLKRIALGIKRYVLDNPRPFVVVNTSGNPPTDVNEPFKTVATGNHFYVVTPTVIRTDMHKSNAGCAYPPTDPLRTVTSGGGFGVVSPLLVPVTHAGERRANSPGEPLPTVTGANRGEFAVVAPSLVQVGYGERAGQEPRALNIRAPLGTVVAGGAKHAMVAAFLAHLAHGEGKDGRWGKGSSGVNEPVGVIQAQGNNFACVAANLVHLKNNTGPTGCDEPTNTVLAAGNHAALVYSFLMKYHGQGGQWAGLDAPAPTVDCKDRLSLVTVTIDGQLYAIIDIGMRMLTPRELARAQGFPDEYILCPADITTERRQYLTALGNLCAFTGWGSKSDQVERIGNSVSPWVAKAIVAANCADMATGGLAA